MLKKIGLATVAAAGIAMVGSPAFADVPGYGSSVDNNDHQNGLVNVDKVDVAHNVNVPVGLCGDDVNVLGVQVPVRANGLLNGLPILSPRSPSANNGAAPQVCASGVVGSADGNHG